MNLLLFVAMTLVMMAFLLFDVARDSVVAERIEDRRGTVEEILGTIEGMPISDADLSDLLRAGPFQDLMRKLGDEGVISGAGLFDLNGRNLLRIGDGAVGGYEGVPDAVQAMKRGRVVTRIIKVNNGLFMQAPEDVSISAPIRVSGEVVGGIQVLSPVTGIGDGVVHYNWNIFIMLGIFSLVLVIAVSYSLGQEVVEPMDEILEAMEKVKGGDLEQQLRVRSGNEVGKLARSFNNMVFELKENRDKVSRYVNTLKQANTMLQQAEQRLIQGEKLATIGRLASGVANEVGNPLGAIYGFLEALKKRVTEGEAMGLIGKIEKETNRINEIIFSLLDLSRGGENKQVDVPVNELIEKTISLLSSQKALTGIDSRLQLKLDLPVVKGDQRDFQQALINILINAIEAMPSGGILSIRTGTILFHGDTAMNTEPARREGDPAGLDFSPLRQWKRRRPDGNTFREGEEVVFLEVADTGKGIRREHLKEIFDPFFTLKDKDRGSGLGLAVCERIIHEMGGMIKVDSIWGKGATFTIYLPIGGVDGDSCIENNRSNESVDHRSRS